MLILYSLSENSEVSIILIAKPKGHHMKGNYKISCKCGKKWIQLHIKIILHDELGFIQESIMC